MDPRDTQVSVMLSCEAKGAALMAFSTLGGSIGLADLTVHQATDAISPHLRE